MDITVYLPDHLGALARKEGLNLSRMLRDAVSRELGMRGIAWESEFVTLDEATELIRDILKDGKWHKRRDLGKTLGGKVRDAHFGHVRKALRIEIRREGWGPGSYFEWRLPTEASDRA
jgi:hypothetical protein